MLRPLFDAVRTALTEEDLIPAAGGGYARGAEPEAGQPGGAGRAAQPPVSSGRCSRRTTRSPSPSFPATKTSPLHWPATCARRSASGRSPRPTCSPGPRAGSSRRSPTSGSRASTGSCTPIPTCGGSRGSRGAGRPGPDPADHPARRRQAGRALRLGGPPAGLPARRLRAGPAGTGFPTVRRAVADAPAARAFLEALKFTEPDIVAEVLEIILPRYARAGGKRGGGTARWPWRPSTRPSTPRTSNASCGPWTRRTRPGASGSWSSCSRPRSSSRRTPRPASSG